MAKLFIGNLPWAATEDDIKSWVSKSGVPFETVQLILDRETNKPRGFGFLTIPDSVDADAAIEKLGKSKLLNRNITVNTAKPLDRDRDAARAGRR